MALPTTATRAPARTRGAITPPIDELRTWLAAEIVRPSTVPIFREILADVETPVSAYLKIRNGGSGFILESVEGGKRIARYSFIGADSLLEITMRDGTAEISSASGIEQRDYSDPLAVIEEILAQYRSATMPGLPLPRFLGGAVGYLSYEAVRSWESRVGTACGQGRGMPEARFSLVDSLLVFDHVERTIKAVSHMHLDSGESLEEAYEAASARVDALVTRLRAPLPSLPIGAEPVEESTVDRCQSNTTPERYHQIIEAAQEYIRAGDIFQVVLSQRVDLPTPAHPFTIYRALRTVNPSPYMFYLDFGDHQIVGASPELLVRLEDGIVTNHPIAGTRPRGATAEADVELAADLLSDEKERAEHIMLVDLGRNDVGRVSKPGTVHVPKLMEIEHYSHVMHIVSNVEGEIQDGRTCYDALRACFPAGTVSGAPKVRAMEIIAEMETDRRGPYAGAVGYIDFGGRMDTCIALRTLVIKDGVASMQAGGGVVADSTPDGEYAESYHKMRALLRAIELAESIEAAEFDRQRDEAPVNGVNR